MNYTYAFSIIGCRVYITDDEYAKNRFKYLALRCPAVFSGSNTPHTRTSSKIFERDRIFIKSGKSALSKSLIQKV